MAANSIFHAQTKYIEVDYHFIREKVLNKDISLIFISTQAQIAYLFTKGLTKALFFLLRDKLFIRELLVSLRGEC